MKHLMATCVASLLGLALTPPGALAQDFPARPLRLIVPYPPGGPTDIVARQLAQEMATGLKQPIVIENIPGAGGNIGASASVRAEPDGYTMLMGTLQNLGINPHLFKLDYDPLVDLTAVSLVVKNPNVMLANASLPADDLRGVIEYARAHPDTVSYASSGAGSSTHLSGELMNRMAGLKMIHVPYKGSAPALVDLMGGQVQISFDNVVSAYPHLKSGKLKAIAVTTSQRVPSLPDVPTMKESGLPEFETEGWSAIMVPAGTPDAIVQRLGREVERALREPKLAQRLEKDGAYPAPNSPSEMASYLKAESAKWGAIIEQAHISLQ